MPLGACPYILTHKSTILQYFTGTLYCSFVVQETHGSSDPMLKNQFEASKQQQPTSVSMFLEPRLNHPTCHFVRSTECGRGHLNPSHLRAPLKEIGLDTVKPPSMP
eukprot:1140017-Pelagomonas_calceolata.AAC.2